MFCRSPISTLKPAKAGQQRLNEVTFSTYIYLTNLQRFEIFYLRKRSLQFREPEKRVIIKKIKINPVHGLSLALN